MKKVSRFEKIMHGVLPLTFKEEAFNTATHGFMSLFMLIVLPIFTTYSYLHYGFTRALAISIFIICLFLMFLTSTLYHSMPFESPQKAIFRILDHICIYLAIAGTYTPVALCIIKGWQGIVILCIQWIMVIIGILYKSIATSSMPKLSLTIYLIMGWTAILFIRSLIINSSFHFLLYIVLGGILYSIGAYFYAKASMKYSHVIWHVFIVVASLFHVLAVVFYM